MDYSVARSYALQPAWAILGAQSIKQVCLGSLYTDADQSLGDLLQNVELKRLSY